MKHLIRVIVTAAGIIAFLFVGSYLSMLSPEEESVSEYTKSEIEEIKSDAYNEGFSDGYEVGTEDGYESGYYDGENGILYNHSHVPSTIVYYVSGGYCYHIDPNCEALQNSDKIREAFLDDVSDELKPCNLCTPHSEGNY